jgi:predicted site-specific integrase-resolvase
VTTTELEAATLTLSPEDAARRLGVESSTLANWRWRGAGPRYLKVGGRVRYRASDLAAYLDAQTRASTSDPGPSAD